MNLMEAFTALDKLNEDVFTVDAEGIKKLQDFVQNDDTVDELDVFNLDAEPDEDVDENECHIGDAILDCCVCHSKVFKPVAEIIVDEESQVANKGEECPYCYSVEGYKVVGEVNPLENNDESDYDDLGEGLFNRKKKPSVKSPTKFSYKWVVKDGWDKDLIVSEHDTKDEAEKSAASRGNDGRYKVQQIKVTESTEVEEVAEESEEIIDESVCSNLEEDWDKGVLISMNLPLSEVEKAVDESKISIPAYSDGEWNSTTSLKVYGFPNSYGMVDKDKGIFKLNTNFYDSDIKEFGTLRDFNKAVRENDLSLFGDAVLNYTKQIKDSLVKKGISVQDTTIELKTGNQSTRKSVNESIDLLTKENTIASLLKDNMNELASIIDVNELRERIIELVDNSDIAGKPVAQKLKRDLYSKKSAGALLSTIATYMTGDKVIKTGKYKKAANESYRRKSIKESIEIPSKYRRYFMIDDYEPDEGEYQIGDKISGFEVLAYTVPKGKYEDIIDEWPLLLKDSNGKVFLGSIVNDRIYPFELNDYINETYRKVNKSFNHRKSIKESDSNEETIGDKLKKYQMWVDYDMEHYGKVSETTQDIIDKEGLQLIKDQYGDYEVSVGSYKAESMKKRLKEDVDSIEIKTDDVSVVIDSAESAEKGEEILPEGSCKECSAEQTIEPVSEETKEEIEIENIDKDTIEDAVEECLTESFTNVKFFKASDIIQRKNRFIVEGIIGFKSGKKRNTNFVFRPSLLRESKIVFRGFNRDLKESVKSISLNCKKQGNKIIVESCKVSK